MEGDVVMEKKGDESIQVTTDDQSKKEEANNYKGYGFKKVR